MQRFLNEGRLEIIGGPWTIPDLNLSHGESIARNQLMGLDWLETTFGLRPAIACMEDAFGAPSSLPALLQSCGMTFYRASRMPRPGKKDLSGPLRWIGHDGACLPACGPEGMAWGLGQSSNIDDPPNDFRGMVEQYRRDLRACPYDGSRPVLFSLLGEEHIPTPETIDAFVAALASLRLPYCWATAAEFVRALQESGTVQRAPLVREDLSRFVTGCYSSRIRQKFAIADLEASLLAATNLGALRPGRRPRLAAVWSDLFLMQFHDAYGGCHVADNARYMADVLGRGRTRSAASYAGPRLGNPLLFSRSIPFLVPTGLSGKARKRVVAQPLDQELIASAPLAPLATEAVTVVIATPRTLRGPKSLSTAHARLDLDPQHPLLHLKNGSLPLPGWLRLREDNGTLWTEDYTGREWSEPSGFAQLEKVEQGPVFSRAVWRGALRWQQGLWSGFTSLSWRRSLLLFADAPWLWLRLELDWQGNGTEIGWRFASGDPGVPRSFGSMPFGSVARRAFRPGADGFTGDVFPSPHWAALESERGAWLVLHRGHPAFRAVRGGLENVLLRSPVKRWMPLFPVQPDPGAWENGHHTADFLLVPQATFDPAAAQRLGLAFQTGARACAPLALPAPHAALLASVPSSLVPTSWERTGDGVRLRLSEACGRPATWHLPRGWRGEWRPFTGKQAHPPAHKLIVPAHGMGDVWLRHA